jgi:glycerol-3-phosphate dehydrogenase (NAD(P)+)
VAGRVTVLGAGSYGTALAQLLQDQGQQVTLWTRNVRRAEAIARTRRNPDSLSEFVLSVGATSDLHAAVASADWIVVALPSHAVRSVLGAARPVVPLVLACKGLENETLLTPDGVARAVLGTVPTLILSGPSFAREIMLHHPTAVVLACTDLALAERLAVHFFCDYFRAYVSPDVIGVALAGALKNVIAIAAGVVHGLGLGDNTRAALMTRGIGEITRLAVALGGDPRTLAGLAGLGDLLLTCTGQLSRNRAIGVAIGQGKTLPQAVALVREVAEGVESARAAVALVRRTGVEAPILQAVFRVLHEAQPAREALHELVRRPPGRE